VVQRSATKARTQALNQLHALVLTAPEELRARLRDLNRRERLATCAGFRVRADDDSLPAISRLAMRELAQRVLLLDAQAKTVLDRMRRITTATAPELVAKKGIGPDTAATLLISAGDNPERLGHEKSFAALVRHRTDPREQRTDPEQVPAQPGRRPAGERSVCGASRSSDSRPMMTPAPMSHDAKPKAKPRAKPSAASSATSPARSSTPYPEQYSFDSRSITSARRHPSWQAPDRPTRKRQSWRYRWRP